MPQKGPHKSAVKRVHVKVGDIVRVVSGADKPFRVTGQAAEQAEEGKTTSSGRKIVTIEGTKWSVLEGKVVRVYPDRNRVLVQGVNMRTKHQKPTPKDRQGGIKRIEIPIEASKLRLVSNETRAASRMGRRVVDGRKVRFLKKTGELVDK